MKHLRTLYAKIFGWFWLTVTVGSLLVLAVTVSSGSQPVGRRWMRLTQDMYAHTAIDVYETGGTPALTRYLTVLRESSGMEATLLNEAGEDVLGGTLSPHVARVVAASRRTGGSTFRLGRIWTAASPVKY